MRFASACLGLAWCLMLGCTAKHSPAEESEPEIVIPTGALVVLDEDAAAYFEREGPVFVRLPQPLVSSARGYAVEVLSVSDERLEVRTLDRQQHPYTCAGNFRSADDYELRFWVERADLQQVLVAPKTFAFPDGTKLELRPGIPVLDVASGALAVGSQSLFVPLEDAELGLFYEPPTLAKVDQPGRSLPRDTQLRYGDESHVRAVEPFSLASEVLDLEGSSDGEQLLVFDNACGRFTLRAPASALTSGLYAMKGPQHAIPRMQRSFDPDLAARNAGILGLSDGEPFAASPYGGAFDVEPQVVECKPPRWTIASGVALSWANGGRPAGVVRRAHELPELAREFGDQVCFRVELWELCARASKLARTVDPNCAEP